MSKKAKILLIVIAVIVGISVMIMTAFSILNLFFNIIKINGVSDSITEYPINEDVTELTVDINAADVTITEGESFFIKSNLEYLDVWVTDGHLVIKDRSNRVNDYNGAILDICIPKNTVFEYLCIDTGAADISADIISTQRLEMEIGAGNVIIDTLNIDYDGDIDGGAGSLTVKRGALNDIDIAMGVGKLELTASLRGNSDFELGVGKTVLVLMGSREDYRIKFDSGIANATVDGEEMAEGQIWGDGANRIDISGGVGAIDISFED